MDKSEEQSHNREAVKEILEYVLNDYYMLDIILNYNMLVFVTNEEIEKHILFINLLEYKVGLGDCLDDEDLDKIENACLVGVHKEVIDKDTTKKVLYKLSECIQAMENDRYLIRDYYFRARFIRSLSNLTLKDVIKQ